MVACRRAVLVTGTSTGIGRASALRLVRAGFDVFAGVRNEADGEALRNVVPGGQLTPVLLDVTDAGQIADAAARVADAVGETGLAGLVNNAGTGLAGPVELLSIGALRQYYEVNVIGQMAVAQAMLPLLRTGHGRLVTIGSVGGWVTMPFGGALCSGKHALRSLNDALRMELKPWGVSAVLIEPGLIKTDAIDKLQADIEPTVESFGPRGRVLYETAFRAMTAKAIQREHAQGVAPEVVAEIVLRAQTAGRPRTRYPVGPTARSLSVLGHLLPNPALDALRYRVLGLGRTAKSS